MSYEMKHFNDHGFEIEAQMICEAIQCHEILVLSTEKLTK